ncbi:Spermidine/putrescine import ATP-binding protein PotA [Variovorax sp. PBL-H6]|uniref:ABC transporter ATP-binding protein n=1 Tax=Variovorax sp. PBL-H6 TaxID=434009 RepID=UPI0013171C96|nr:ABC transporter ATP-binding protein [Variovorax sp. PBL-H6]VTU23823.1 Spermidine/putrescine import ATP-binding protein PotA [Variovorax sp. PBL-H6]
MTAVLDPAAGMPADSSASPAGMGAQGAAAFAGTLPERASAGIRVEALCKRYGSFTALDQVALAVKPGEFLTLLGPSGSGKTTLLNIVAGFIRPDSGSLWFGGEDVTQMPVHRRELGMVFQNYALFPHKSVYENIAFPLRVRKMPQAEIDRRVRAVLELVQLPQLGGRSIAALSGGQRQRVALARAVVFSPRIVLMDEPLSALDKNLREQMQVEIRRLHEKIGATTLYVTHDQREALTMSDRIAVMNRGQIEQCDSAAAVYEKPASRFVAGFIGETTLVPAAANSSRSVMLPGGTLLGVEDPLPASASLHVALRAERLLLPGEYGAGANRIPAVIEDVIYQGDSLLLVARIEGGHSVSVRKPLRGAAGAHGFVAGQPIALGLMPAATIVVAD